MAGQKDVSVGVKFTGDPSGFEKAAKQASAASTALKKNVREATGVLDETTAAIGGAVGEVGGAVSQLLTASTGIGALVVVVGLLAKAWKASQENIDLYLKSADKLAAGAAGFDADAENARIDTRKRANGMIKEGYRIEQENMAKLIRGELLYNEEQLKHFALLVKEGQQMQKNGRDLRDQVTGISDKADFQIKYNALLQEQEKLNDEGLDKKSQWKELDAELAKNNQIIANQASDEVDKKNAVINAELIANALLKEKNDYINRQLKNIREIADMTNTQEVVETRIADLLEEKAANTEKYYNTMVKVDGMEVKAAANAKKQADEAERKLKALKEANGEITRVSVSRLSINKPIPVRGGGMARGGGDLAGGPSEQTSEMIGALGIAQQAVVSLENTFQHMFMNVGGGFKGMVSVIMDSIKMLVAQLIGKAAVFALLQMILPGSGAAVGALTGLRKFIGIPGFASGTNFAPGGLSLVGERGPELVNLPRGSRVMPMLNNGPSRLETVVRGADLAIILNRYNTQKGINT